MAELVTNGASTTRPLDDLASMDDDRRMTRLRFLVERSKVYASVLTERLNQAKEIKTDHSSVQVKPTSGNKKRKSGPLSKFITKAERASENESLLECDLHEYQREGVRWLVSLFENGLNGILADEMGLGKTVQTLGLLCYLIEHGIPGPFLIVAPLSVITGWEQEIRHFAPRVGCLKYYGSKDERAVLARKLRRADLAMQPIIITSYEILIRDSAVLRSIEWKYVIVDEGHRLKNINSRLIKELKQLNSSANRLLLTGTPLQNNLAELWSLLNFLLPDIFSDLELFQSWFDSLNDTQTYTKMHPDQDSPLISSLHDILRPFLLRRLKRDVNLDLPPKREHLLFCALTESQRSLYQSILDKKCREYLTNKVLTDRGYSVDILHKNSSKSKKRARKRKNYAETNDEDEISDDDKFEESLRRLITTTTTTAETGSSVDESTRLLVKAALSESGASKSLQNVVMQLRLACNSPHLFYYPQELETASACLLVQESGKLQMLDALTCRLVEQGHRTLIFSQFSRMLDLIQDWAQLFKQWRVCRIDGSTSQDSRQEQIKDFQDDDDIPLFLLSTRAGGLGLNLTAADTVVIFDSDWNPHQDLQAMDRVHRLGQTKPVLIFRLSTRNTVEESLLNKASAKLKLEHLVIEQGKFKGLGKGQSETQVLQELQRGLDLNQENVDSAISNVDWNMLLDRSADSFKL